MQRILNKSLYRSFYLRDSLRYYAIDKKNVDWSLYLVADSSIATKNNRTIESVVHEGLRGGVSVVQLREKALSTNAFIKHAKKVKAIIDEYNKRHKTNVPLIINDNIDVALAVDADGVHVGQGDTDPNTVRRKIGLDKILGVTVGNRQHVDKMLHEPYPQIDYFGTDAIYQTPSKTHHDDGTPMKALGIQGLQKLVEQIKDAYEEKYPVPTPPIVAIGGINIHNVDQVIEGTPVNGIAVISAIVASEDPYFASRSLRTVIDKSVGEKETKAIHSHRSVEKLTEDVLHLFQKIREKKPLIHHITNYVVMNQTANATLHLGGSPVMSHAIEEVEEMVSLCNALVINPGTLSAPWIRAMSLAGLRANSLGIPIIFDPVGAGATSFRTRTYQIFLKELDANIIKGNSAEIGSMYGDMSVETRGVDSAVGVENPERVVQTMSTRYNGAIVAVTGRTDYASDGVNCIAVENNSDMLAGLTGTGCTVSALIACFAGVTKEDYLAATVGGLAVMGVCAELAEKDISVKGPASFNVALYDRIATLTPEQLRANMKLKNIQVVK